MTAAAIYAAGSVRRYHANPRLAHIPQTNADHQGRCVQLAITLLPKPMRTAALLEALATHDVAERWVGDLPADFKTAEPDTARAHAEIEDDWMVGLGLSYQLSLTEWQLLKLIDMIEARAFVALYAPNVLAGEGWPEQRAAIEARAWQIDKYVAAAVVRLLDDMEAGRF